jgi:hypothetical protein
MAHKLFVKGVKYKKLSRQLQMAGAFKCPVLFNQGYQGKESGSSLAIFHS